MLAGQGGHLTQELKRPSLFSTATSLFHVTEFPVRAVREFRPKRPCCRDISSSVDVGVGGFRKFPCIFPVIREFGLETGWQWTASSAKFLSIKWPLKRRRSVLRRRFHVASCCKKFPSNFNGHQSVSAAPRNMDATWKHYGAHVTTMPNLAQHQSIFPRRTQKWLRHPF